MTTTRKIFQDENSLPEEIKNHPYYHSGMLKWFENKLYRELCKIIENLEEYKIELKKSYLEEDSFLDFETDEFYSSYWNHYTKEYQNTYYSIYQILENYNEDFFNITKEDYKKYNCDFIDDYLEIKYPECSDDAFEFVMKFTSYLYNKIGTTKEVIQEEFPEIYNQTKWIYSSSIYHISKNKEYKLDNEEEAVEFLKSEFYSKVDHINGTLYLFDEIIEDFIGNNINIYEVAHLLTKDFKIPSPEELNEAFDLEYKLGKDWKHYLPEEVKEEYGITSGLNYRTKVKYKKIKLTSTENEEIRNENISNKLFAKALFSINKIAKIYADMMRENYHTLHYSNIDYFDDTYEPIQDKLRNNKENLYSLKEKALKNINPKEIHLANPKVEWKKYNVDEVNNLEQFLVDNPVYRTKTKYQQLTKKQKRAISQEDKNNLMKEIGCYIIPQYSNYEKFLYYEIEGYGFHKPINNLTLLNNYTNLPEKIIGEINSSYKQEELIDREIAEKIIKIYLKQINV